MSRILKSLVSFCIDTVGGVFTYGDIDNEISFASFRMLVFIVVLPGVYYFYSFKAAAALAGGLFAAYILFDRIAR
jgi:hypothetical protein